MSDYMITGTAADGKIRVLAAVATELVDEAQKRHQTYPVATAALGRTMTGALLLAQLHKDIQHLTIRVLGEGPLGGVVVDTDGKGHVRGYVKQPKVLLPLNPKGKLDVGRAVGLPGTVHVSKDIGLKHPYSGSAPLVSGEIADDLTHYLVSSEQTPSALSLGVLVNPDGSVAAAGGILMQILPSGEEWAPELERRLKALPSVTTLIDHGASPEDMLAELVGDLNLFLQAKIPVRFQCSCNADRSKTLLASLGEAELQSMIQEDHGAEMTCHFCQATYQFSEDDLLTILQEVQKS